MKIFVKNSSNEMSSLAAAIIKDEIIDNPQIILSLPTGSTPIGCLKELVKFHRDEALDFSKVTCFNMDEYITTPKDNPQGNYYFLNKYLYKHINIDRRNTFSPDILAHDRQKACDSYAKLIMENGGIDLILLGIGRDGHIAYNMPGRQLQANVHLEMLSKQTISDIAGYFNPGEDVPTQVMTIGMKEILSSKKVVLIANGKEKSEIVGKFLNNKSITTEIPASFLWLHHDVTIILEKEAAGAVKEIL